MPKIVKLRKGAYIMYAFMMVEKGWKHTTFTENDKIEVHTFVKGRKTIKTISKK